MICAAPFAILRCVGSVALALPPLRLSVYGVLARHVLNVVAEYRFAAAHHTERKDQP